MEFNQFTKVIVVGCGKTGVLCIKLLKEQGIKDEQIRGVEEDYVPLINAMASHTGVFFTSDFNEALEHRPDVAIIAAGKTNQSKIIKKCHLAGIRKIFCKTPSIKKTQTKISLEALIRRREYFPKKFISKKQGEMHLLFQEA